MFHPALYVIDEWRRDEIGTEIYDALAHRICMIISCVVRAAAQLEWWAHREKSSKWLHSLWEVTGGVFFFFFFIFVCLILALAQAFKGMHVRWVEMLRFFHYGASWDELNLYVLWIIGRLFHTNGWFWRDYLRYTSYFSMTCSCIVHGRPDLKK